MGSISWPGLSDGVWKCHWIWKTVMDIDGFFASYQASGTSAEVIVCGGTSSNPLPEAYDQLVRRLPRRHRNFVPSYQGGKVWISRTRTSKMEVLFVLQMRPGFHYAQLVENAHQVAKEFPCIESGCPISRTPLPSAAPVLSIQAKSKGRNLQLGLQRTNLVASPGMPRTM